MTRRCLVAVCCNQAMLFTKTAQSLMEIGWGDRISYARDKTGFTNVVFQWFTGSPRVDMLRNQAAEMALRGIPWTTGAPDEPFTHLIFLDADMVWPTDTIYRLLQHHDVGIVSGLYVLKGPPYAPVHLIDPFTDERGQTRFLRALEFGTELVPVDVVGMGCTIIPVEALRAVGARDWFHYDNDADGFPRVSEDVPFCVAAKAAGWPIYMDPQIKCGHVTAQVIDHRWHHRYQASVAAAPEMGPTVNVTEPA